jgi:bacterioferritin
MSGTKISISLKPSISYCCCEVQCILASKKLLDMLNNAIADEMQAAIQYMWQHVQWKGVEHYAVTEGIKKIAVDEMKHAEKVAERLWYLGGKPTIQPSPIKVGETLTEMLTLDVKAEEGAIKMYKEIMEVAQKEGDVATKEIFEEIEEEEEDHHDFFTSLLEK